MTDVAFVPWLDPDQWTRVENYTPTKEDSTIPGDQA